MNKIRKNDKVRVMSGRDRGKEGKIIQVFPKLRLVVVEGINIRYKHLSKRQATRGERVEYSAPINVSNVRLISPKTSKLIKVGFKVQEDGSKTRVDKKTNEVID